VIHHLSKKLEGRLDTDWKNIRAEHSRPYEGSHGAARIARIEDGIVIVGGFDQGWKEHFLPYQFFSTAKVFARWRQREDEVVDSI